MVRFLPVANEGARHPLRRALPPPGEPIEAIAGPPGKKGEDVAFFLLSFVSAFIILYSFII